MLVACRMESGIPSGHTRGKVMHAQRQPHPDMGEQGSDGNHRNVDPSPDPRRGQDGGIDAFAAERRRRVSRHPRNRTSLARDEEVVRLAMTWHLNR